MWFWCIFKLFDADQNIEVIKVSPLQKDMNKSSDVTIYSGKLNDMTALEFIKYKGYEVKHIKIKTEQYFAPIIKIYIQEEVDL